MRLIALFMMLLTTSAYAQKRVAVLPVQSGKLVPKAEKEYYTILLRGIAGNELNAAGFLVLDKSNFQAVFGKDISLADCLDSCAVNTGIKAQAHYVVTAKLIPKGAEYRLVLSAHDTKSRYQLRQVVIKIKTKPEFETRIEAEAPAVFRAILRAGGGVVPRRGAVLGGAAPSAVDFDVTDEASSAIIRFESTPSGALVNVDGRALCETPCSKSLARGSHQVALTKLGFVGSSRQVVVRSSQTLSFKLLKDAGVLQVSAAESGLPVEITGIDGRVAGKHQTPLQLELVLGLYTVRVGDERCTVPHIQKIKVTRGQTTKAVFRPAVLPAGLKVAVKDNRGNDLEGQVYANDKRLGSSLQTHKLPVCSQNIEVDLGKYGRKTVSVTLKAKTNSAHRAFGRH